MTQMHVLLLSFIKRFLFLISNTSYKQSLYKIARAIEERTVIEVFSTIMKIQQQKNFQEKLLRLQ
jgi:hypothetical protein